jgi:hypothetical protein
VAVLAFPPDARSQLGQQDAPRADDLTGTARLAWYERPVVVDRIGGRGHRGRAAIACPYRGRHRAQAIVDLRDVGHGAAARADDAEWERLAGGRLPLDTP